MAEYDGGGGEVCMFELLVRSQPEANQSGARFISETPTNRATRSGHTMTDGVTLLRPASLVLNTVLDLCLGSH